MWPDPPPKLKQDSAVLRLKFTRMSQNIVTYFPSSAISRHAWLYTPALHHFHLSFSLFQTHVNMLSDSHMAFFSDTEINKGLCLLVGSPCRQISWFQLSNKPTQPKVRRSQEDSLVVMCVIVLSEHPPTPPPPFPMGVVCITVT